MDDAALEKISLAKVGGHIKALREMNLTYLGLYCHLLSRMLSSVWFLSLSFLWCVYPCGFNHGLQILANILSRLYAYNVALNPSAPEDNLFDLDDHQALRTFFSPTVANKVDENVKQTARQVENTLLPVFVRQSFLVLFIFPLPVPLGVPLCE